MAYNKGVNLVSLRLRWDRHLRFLAGSRNLRVWVTSYIIPLGIVLRVSLHRLDQPVVAVHRSVVCKHVDYEPLLDGLLRGVDVEWEVPGVPALWRRVAKDFQVLFLGVAVKVK